MNGFEVYKIYLAIKLHFTSKNQSYDFHKHNGRTTARLATFTKRRDRYFFHKLSKSYNDKSIVDYFLSNFVSNTNIWVGDIIGQHPDHLGLLARTLGFERQFDLISLAGREERLVQCRRRTSTRWLNSEDFERLVSIVGEADGRLPCFVILNVTEIHDRVGHEHHRSTRSWTIR